MNKFKTIVMLMLMVFLIPGLLLAQGSNPRRNTAPQVRELRMSATSNTVYFDPDTTSVTLAPFTNVADTFYVAFPGVYYSYFHGLPTVTMTIGDTLYVDAWGYPCIQTGAKHGEYTTLAPLILHQNDDSLDSLIMMSDSLFNVGTHRLEWGVRAGGDSYPWGPANGMMIVARWKTVETNADTTDTSMVFRVWGQ